MATLRSRCGHYMFVLFLSSANTGRKNSPFWHHRTTLSGCIFAAKACIDNRKKLVKHRYLLHMSSWYGELRLTNGWDLLASLGHPCKFQRVSLLGSVTAWHSRSGRQPNFAALNRGRHLYLAGRPSRWALAHILVCNDWQVEGMCSSYSLSQWHCVARVLCVCVVSGLHELCCAVDIRDDLVWSEPLIAHGCR